MEDSIGERRVLEKLWMERMNSARARYRHAKAAAAALHVEAALAEYRRVLMIFNDLVAYGKVPPDEPQD